MILLVFFIKKSKQQYNSFTSRCDGFGKNETCNFLPSYSRSTDVSVN